MRSVVVGLAIAALAATGCGGGTSSSTTPGTGGGSNTLTIGQATVKFNGHATPFVSSGTGSVTASRGTPDSPKTRS